MPLRKRAHGLRFALLACTAIPFFATGCMLVEEGLPPAGPRPAPAPLGVAYDPTGNPEFTKNDGIDVINAEAAYLRGATGGGTTVAVVDTGIDATHPDLAANVAAASTDITGGGSLDDATGHGTKVAGIIAAERNDAGTHGVAYDAGILAVKAYRCDGSGCNFHTSDVAGAVNYATDHSAHVINMSLGGPSGGDPDLNAAVRRAANAGAFVVMATGNAGLSEPYYPAILAADPSFGGMVISVTAVSDLGVPASFSNDCGSTMNGCIAAPGVAIETTKDGATSATQTTSVSGTSFAAPHVSGALALLTQLYPDAYVADPRSIAMFMFDGARDLGAAGIDPVYGRGMLDVAGAMNVADAAIADAAIPLSSGASASLSGSSMVVSPAFGDALASLSILQDAVAVIRLSDGDHAYRARLDGRIARARGWSPLDSFLAEPAGSTVGTSLGGAMSLTMALSGDLAPSADGHRSRSGAADGAMPAMRLAGTLDHRTDLKLGIGISSQDAFAAGPAAASAGALFLSAGETMGPFARIAGTGKGLGVTRSVAGATSLSLGLFEGETSDLLPGAAGGGRTRLGQAGLGLGFASGGAVRLDLGVLDEASGLLGSQGAGAFATGAGSSTHYAVFSGSLPVVGGVDLLGGVTVATTRMGRSPDAVLSDWSDVHSSAFGVGFTAADVFTRGDRFGLLVGQPLRVHDASATLTVSTALAGDGQVAERSERVSLTPSGREVDVELGYRWNLLPGTDMSSWVLLRREPGHDAAAGMDAAAGLKLRAEF